jgi:hypothetical protein
LAGSSCALLVVLDFDLRAAYQQKQSSGFAAGIKTGTLFGTASFSQSFYSAATQAVVFAAFDLPIPRFQLVVVVLGWFLLCVVGRFGILFEDRFPTKRRILWICCWHKNQHLIWHRFNCHLSRRFCGI